MFSIRTGRLVAVAAALMTLGAVSAARAEMMFRNSTDQPVHFSISCDGDGQDHWTVAPYGTRSLFCNNGSRAAVVEIVTTHGGYDDVVHYTVWDGQTYKLGYDRDGDVNMWQL
jgi:hypothetical protein